VAPGDYVKISVTDTGEGIPPSLKDSIFEPFVTSKKVGKGSGLGLSMVYGFVTQSGGCISVYSEEGQGTMFTLYLPRNRDDTNAASDTPALQKVPAVSGKTILVAEDDDRVRKVVVKRIKRLGHAILEAPDGYAALKLFEQHSHIDLVFSDITMTEGMTGYDLALAVREINPEIPVLLTSGYAEDIINPEKLEQSGLQLLRKPYEQQELEKYLADMLT
jgi:CheY-like chemotaxis protein